MSYEIEGALVRFEYVLTRSSIGIPNRSETLIRYSGGNRFLPALMFDTKPVVTPKKSAKTLVGMFSIMHKRYQRVNFGAIPFGKRKKIYLMVKKAMAEEEQKTLTEIRRKNLEFMCADRAQQADIAAKYDCTPGYISNMINGRKDIGEKTARKLETCLGKPTYWMDTPQWRPTSAIRNQMETQDKLVALEHMGGHKYYPRVVGTARCGDNGYYLDLEGGDGYIEFESEPGSIAIRIKGHSMHPAIREGWYVVIEPNKQPAIGEYVLAKFRDGKKMVKELLQVKADGYLLLSVNDNERITAAFDELEDLQAITAIVPPSKHKEW